jgi:hypothetical protein
VLVPKVPLLISALDDGRVEIRIMHADTGKHNAAVRGTLYIGRTPLNQNDGGLAAALVTFAEFQHDAESGAVLGERDAQVEFEALRETIRRSNPSSITPYIESLRHGN